jgi:hypothetical protein
LIAKVRPCYRYPRFNIACATKRPAPTTLEIRPFKKD